MTQSALRLRKLSCGIISDWSHKNTKNCKNWKLWNVKYWFTVFSFYSFPAHSCFSWPVTYGLPVSYFKEPCYFLACLYMPSSCISYATSCRRYTARCCWFWCIVCYSNVQAQGCFPCFLLHFVILKSWHVFWHDFSLPADSGH